MKIINLTQNQIALVDDEDYDKINKHKWYANKISDIYYAVRTKNKKAILMHRFLLNPNDSQVIDHVNGNGLDNRKCNIRICSIRDNTRNRTKIINCSSQYKGVYWHKRDKRWISRIRVDNVYIQLGRYYTEIEAAKAYNDAAVKYFGEFARLNTFD